MSGWIKEKEGNVTLVHHSTSSQIELILDEDKDYIKYLFLDYYEYEALKKIIEKIDQ